MKRVIKFWQTYNNDKTTFSTCSTNYDILPFLVENDASDLELQSVAYFLNFETYKDAEKIEAPQYLRSLFITNAIKLKETKINRHGETVIVFLGLITLPALDYLPAIEDLSGVIDGDKMYGIFNNQDLDIRDIIELDGTQTMLVESWKAFHYTGLLGYQKFDDLLDSLDIKESVFDDSVFQCSYCNEWDHNDSGYTYNYRVIGWDLVGCNCGCLVDATVDHIEDYINDPEKCIESEVIEKIEAEKLETFIGGMVDGRGGYIFGESVREGSPREVLKEYQEKYPGADFVFVHEESGQFQTYFSIYKMGA